MLELDLALPYNSGDQQHLCDQKFAAISVLTPLVQDFVDAGVERLGLFPQPNSRGVFEPEVDLVGPDRVAFSVRVCGWVSISFYALVVAGTIGLAELGPTGRGAGPVGKFPSSSSSD